MFNEVTASYKSSVTDRKFVMSAFGISKAEFVGRDVTCLSGNSPRKAFSM
jgi:hypothetical protein